MSVNRRNRKADRSVRLTKFEDGTPGDLAPFLRLLIKLESLHGSPPKLIAPPDHDQEQPQQPAPKKQPRKPARPKPRKRSL